MSRQVRQRVTAIVLGGLVFGAPMLATGTAGAQAASGSTRAVVFSGSGLLGLSCDSRPSVESISVPARGTIRVVNETGYAAQLMLGDEPQGTLPDDGSADVMFRRGRTAVKLEPKCVLDAGSSAVVVTASSSPSPVSKPSEPAPKADAVDMTPMLAPADPDRASALAPTGSDRAPAGSPDLGAASSAERPQAEPVPSPDSQRRPAHDSRSAAPTTDPSTRTTPRSTTSAHATIKSVEPVTGTSGSAAPTIGGMPPGDSRTLRPGVPRPDLDPVPVDSEPAADPSVPAEVAAAEPMAALEPMRDGGPLGLLALTAAVCVVGVTIAAIRAFVSQRANRAWIA